MRREPRGGSQHTETRGGYARLVELAAGASMEGDHAPGAGVCSHFLGHQFQSQRGEQLIPTRHQDWQCCAGAGPTQLTRAV